MSFLTDVLRDKSGLDGDGKELVGAALGFGKGKSPRIQVNKLQTDTEKNIQIGLQELLKGMYSFVRNPRSHERVEDTKKTADTIILFLNHLLDFLGESQQSFTIEGFISLVTDRYFVRDQDYVEELVQKIPVRKRSDTIIELYRQKTWLQSDNFQPVIEILLKRLSENEVDEFLLVVSDELQQVQEEYEISLAVKVLPAYLWPRIQKMPRLRAENALIEAVEGATYEPESKYTSNTDATWISNIAEYLSPQSKSKLEQIVWKKLQSDDMEHQSFVAQYMLSTLLHLFRQPFLINRCANYLCECVENGNKFMEARLPAFVTFEAPKEWEKEFEKRLPSMILF